MKGGITSGVIYPLAICKLAEVYRLRSIGGASAGAIAAAAAAAAECGRQRHLERVREAQRLGKPVPALPSGASFEGLEMLPAEIGAPVGLDEATRLQTLFQPTRIGRPVFRLALALIASRAWHAKLAAVCRAAADVAPIPIAIALLGFGPLLVWMGRRADHLSDYIALVLAVLGVLAALLVFVFCAFVRRTNRALGPDNGYGLCPGFLPNERAELPGLTTWLADLLDQLAGQERDGAPLCVGDLAEQKIDFLAMTTNVTHGRPYRLPFEKGTDYWFFRRSEFERLFPKRVVDFMVERSHAMLHPKRKKLRRLFEKANEGRETADYYPFPKGADLPIVVAARMSLSFPVLIQAVPLHAIDWTLKSNRTEDGVRLERCWFSDGGACSNLPLHFFDALLPSRPTFALNLRAPHPEHELAIPPFEPGKSERNNVWLPKRNGDGVAERWNRFEDGEQKYPLARFLGALLGTMQSWNDQLTSKHPGYRDRVVHIHHNDVEGGLNLGMTKDVLDRLAARGAAAGEVLREKFDPASGSRGWDNHLWVRYRVLLATLAEEAKAFAQLGDTKRSDLLRLLDNPPGYALTKAQRRAVDRVNQQLVELAGELDVQPTNSLGHRAPKPRAQLKTRPTSG